MNFILFVATMYAYGVVHYWQVRRNRGKPRAPRNWQ